MDIRTCARLVRPGWRYIRDVQRRAISRSLSTTNPVSSINPLYKLSEDEQLMKDTVSRFAQEKVGPYVQQMDEESRTHPEVIKALFETGLMGLEIPASYGGSGLNFFSSILTSEELAKVCMGISGIVDVQDTLVVNTFSNFGSEEQKKQYFPRLVKDTIGAFALTEAVSGSDAFALATRAKKEGEWWYINGSKQFISNIFCDYPGIILVMANAAPEKGYRGITCFIVENNAPGLELGTPENKMGIRAQHTCALQFDNVKVHESAMLGKIGDGYKIAIGTLNEGRIGCAAICLGVAQGAFKASVEYTKERQQFGRKIFSFQGMQHQIAHARTQIEAARLLTYNAARMKEAGLPYLKEGAMAKYFASEAACDVCRIAIDWAGGVGFMKSFPLEKYYRDIKIGTIYEGTSNIQLNTIAKAIENEGF